MRLLLDEMWPPVIAEQLRRRGHEVAAVAERGDLRGCSDEVVLAAARSDARAVATENAPDYRRLAAFLRSRGDHHPGLVLTTNRRFPRHGRETVGRMVVALDELLTRLAETSDALVDQEVWLRREAKRGGRGRSAPLGPTAADGSGALGPEIS